jgi:hypothetical protein
MTPGWLNPDCEEVAQDAPDASGIRHTVSHESSCHRGVYRSRTQPDQRRLVRPPF